MLTVSLASLRRHRQRYAAAALAVLLGVAFSALTFSFTASATNGLGDALAEQYAAADVVVQTPTGRVPPALVSRIAALPEVSASAVSSSRTLQVRWSTTGGPSYVSVGELPDPAELRWQELEIGRFPAGPHEAVLASSTAESRDLGIGDTVELTELNGARGPGPDDQRRHQHQVRVVGLVDSQAAVTGSSEVFVPGGVLARWDHRTATSQVVATAAAGVSPDELRAAVTTMDRRLDVRTSDQLRREATSSLTGGVDVVGLFFQAFALIALFVAALVIANTFTIVLAQRTRDLALLRCVGAERRQVFAGVLLEALVLGVVAAAAGVALGLGLGALLVLGLDRTSLPLSLSLASPTAVGVAVPFAVGVVITLVAALPPARRSTKVRPLQALRPDGPATTIRTNRHRNVSGAVLLCGGGLGLLVAMRTSSVLVGVLAGSLTFLGVLVLGPVIFPALVRSAGSVRGLLPRRVRGGVPVELALANAVRNPGRTAATSSALLIGVTLISVLTVGASSVSASSAVAIDSTNPVDLVVATGTSELTEGLVEQLRSIDGVSQVAALRGRTARAGRDQVTVATVGAADRRLLRDPQLASSLAGDTAVLPADHGGPRRGAIRVTSGTREVRLPATSSALPAGPILVPPPVLAALGGPARTVAVWLAVSADANPQAVMSDLDSVVAATGQEADLQVSGGYLERVALSRALEVMLLVATGLLAMAVAIALIGVSNTLSLSVIERTREQGLLRALGLTRVQLRATLAAEAVLMSSTAAALGVLLGIALGWAGTVTLIGTVTDQGAVLDVPWVRLGGIVVVALVAGLLAAHLPGRRAARIAPATALAHE